MGGAAESVFGFAAAREQAEVRAFYGDYAYEALKRATIQDREWRALVSRRAPELVDDVAGQIRHG